jgi:hypothetical protein
MNPLAHDTADFQGAAQGGGWFAGLYALEPHRSATRGRWRVSTRSRNRFAAFKHAKVEILVRSLIFLKW